MTRYSVALSAGSIVLTLLVWAYSPVLLDRIGLSAFDPLDRVCLIVVLLSVAESVAARWGSH